MNRRTAAAKAVAPLPSSVFADDEPVLQSRPLIEGVEVPVFGQTDVWPFLATRKPANASASERRAAFWSLSGRWNLRVREVAMVMLNPQHPAVTAAGINRGPEPARCNTVNRAIFELRWLADWATERAAGGRVGLARR